MTLSAFEKFCADTGCPDNVHALALWTQRNDAVAALKVAEEVKQGYQDALIKTSSELDKLKAEREHMDKQEPVGVVLLGAARFYKGVTNGAKLYAHPPVPDGKVLVDAKELRTILGCCVELSPCAEPECKQPQSECLSYIERTVEAMLKAAQKGE